MKIVRLADVPKVAAELQGAQGVLRQLVIGSVDGAPTFSVRVFTLRPGGHTPFHTHPFEHVNYVIQGRGVLVDSASQEHNLRQGDFALVLPGEKHQYRNPSLAEDFVFICAVPIAYE